MLWILQAMGEGHVAHSRCLQVVRTMLSIFKVTPPLLLFKGFQDVVLIVCYRFAVSCAAVTYLTAVGALHHLFRLLFPMRKTFPSLAKRPAVPKPQQPPSLTLDFSPSDSVAPRTPTSPTTPSATTDTFLS